MLALICRAPVQSRTTLISVGTSTVAEGVDRVEVSHMSSCIRGAFHGGFQTSDPLINDRQKGRIRFFDIPALVENPMRFDEAYLPSRDEQ